MQRIRSNVKRYPDGWGKSALLTGLLYCADCGGKMYVHRTNNGKYENFDNLTTTMLNEFVEKILVHERDRKGSIETTQEVEIYFNFVGRYIPPHFGEVNLTPEELEALRKKEERKDKLHQAYLRRKANGTQKRYEDKIKAKKKAEIEAKKAAIHAEDMEKGVFIPASSLPKKEPQKAPVPDRAAM